MHTIASKVSTRDRELLPRYYYKLSEKTSCLEKITNYIRVFLTFLFTQVGVIVLIATYMLCGAAIFQNIEADSKMDLAVEAEKIRQNYTQHIWSLTSKYNVLRPQLWRDQVGDLILEFQEEVVRNVQKGYTGTDPGVRVWTFSSSLMYSLTIFTTIGYGNLTPCTSLGKVVTILYALVGIPLMFIYMANIGSILATSFKYSYSKLCRCETKPADLPKKATLPSIREDALSCLDEEIVSRGSTSSYSKLSREDSFRNFVNVPKKVESNTFKSIINLNKNSEEDKTNEPSNKERRQKHSILERLTSKSSGKSENSDKGERDHVKFELVEDIRLVTIPITTCLMVLISYILCGAAIFSAWEGWTYLDGAYFCFISLMTIGFGDFVPGNSYIYNIADNMSEREANAKLVLGSVYLLLGMGIIAMCVNLMQEKIFTQARLLARALGLIREFRHDIED